MTIAADALARSEYTGTGALSAYDYGFRIDAPDHLRVVVETDDSPPVRSVLALDTDYSLDGVGEEGGGTATLLGSYAPLPSGWKIALLLYPPVAQTIDIRNLKKIHFERLEDAFDAVVRIAQRLRDAVDRSFKLPETEAGSAAKVELGSAAERAGKVFAFDGSGNAIAADLLSPGDLIVSAFIETLLDDAAASEALQTLGFSNWFASLIASVDVGTLNNLLVEAAATQVQITANKNDYEFQDVFANPSKARVFRLSSDAPRTITGITGGASALQRVLVNIGSYDLLLAHESASSSAANRLNVPAGCDVLLRPGETIAIVYDSTASRWRVMTRELMQAEATIDLSTGTAGFADFMCYPILNGSIYDGLDGFASVPSGAAADIITRAAETSHPGVVELRTGTATTGTSNLFKGLHNDLLGDGSMEVEGILKIPTLADAGQDYDVYFGIFLAATSEPTSGAYFEYDRDVSPNWLMNAGVGGGKVQNASSVAVDTGWVKLKIKINAAASSTEFFINGVSVGTIAVALPTTALDISLVILKEAGTTSRSVYCDAIAWKKKFTTKR